MLRTEDPHKVYAIIIIITLDHSILYFAHAQTETHSGYLIKYARGGKWWSNPKLVCLFV